MPRGTTEAIITVSCEVLDLVVSHADAALDTLTGKTQWTRPGGEAFVIPLGLIQVSEVQLSCHIANPALSIRELLCPNDLNSSHALLTQSVPPSSLPTPPLLLDVLVSPRPLLVLQRTTMPTSPTQS